MSDEQMLSEDGFGGDSDYLELMSTAHQVENSQRQLQELLDVSTSLEGLIRHLDSITHLTPEHAQSIVLSCETLLQGTAHDSSLLLPSLESSIGGTVSTESLKDRLTGLWKRIVSIILSILSAMKRYWTKVTSYQGRLELTAKGLKKRAAVQRGRSIRKADVELGIEAKALVVGTSAIKDADALIRAVASAMDQYRIVTSMYPKGMLKLGGVYEELYKVSGTNIRQELEDFCAAGIHLPFAPIATSLKAMAYRDTRFGNKQILIAPAVLGGYSLFISLPEDPVRGLVGNELLTMAARQRTAGMRFALTDVNAYNTATGSIKTASGQQVEALADKVLDILNLITKQEADRQVGKISQQIKAVLAQAEAFKGRPAVGGEGSAVYSESLLRFARSYATWASGPLDQMTTNLLTVSRSILIYGRKSLLN